MRKAILFLLLPLFILSVVAQGTQERPQQEQSDIEGGLVIKHPNFASLRQNDDFIFSIYVFNSTGYLMRNDTTSCKLYANNLSGILLARMDLSFTEDYFHTTLTNGNFSSLGLYEYMTLCNTSDIGGYISSEYGVTVSGHYFEPEIIKVTVFLLLALSVFSFLLGLRFNIAPLKWTFLVLSAMFVMIAINVTGVAIADANINNRLVEFFDFFTAIMFYLAWFAAVLAGVLFVISVFYSLDYTRKIKRDKLSEGVM